MGQRFLSFCDGFGEHFRLRTRDVLTQSQQYLSGLMQARRKNMVRVVEVVLVENLHGSRFQVPVELKLLVSKGAGRIVQVVSAPGSRFGGHVPSPTPE